MARKTWQTKADWQAGIAENLEITDTGVKLARPEPAQFIRASEAYKSDGTLVASGVPRYEGAGVRIEEGTSNLIPLAKQKFEGWMTYQGAVVTLTQNVAVPEWGATDATRIQTSGGTSVAKYLFNVGVVPAGELRAERVWVKNTGDKTVKVFANFSDIAADVLPGESKLVKLENIIGNDVNNLQISFRTLTIADSLDFIAWRPQAETKTLATSWTDGTRLPESLSVPVLFDQEGEVEFDVNVTPMSKRQVAGETPRLITLTNSLDGNPGLMLHHAYDGASFGLQTRADDGQLTSIWFNDTLLPNGLRHLRVLITIPAVILYCDGQPIARIDNPELPSGWGRVYLLSSAAGTNQAGTTVGNLRMVVG